MLVTQLWRVVGKLTLGTASRAIGVDESACSGRGGPLTSASRQKPVAASNIPYHYQFMTLTIGTL